MHKLLARLGECVCKLLTLRMKEEKKKNERGSITLPTEDSRGTKATATIYILHTQFDVYVSS